MSSVSEFVIRGMLLASGLLATGIAVTILVAPDPFYAGYGIDISTNASLANELKAPAGTLLVAGVLMLVGVVRFEFAATSLAVAAVVYLSYGMSRLLSFAVDGIPHTALVSAAILELALGAVCLLDFVRVRASARRASGVRQLEGVA